MANNFTAEANNTAGAIFATRQIDASSIHYPIGLVAWGSSAAEAVTSTSSPFPTQLFGNGLSSAAPIFAGNNSAHPLFVRGMTSSAVAVTGTVSLSGNNSVVTSSAAPLHVRGLTDSHVAVTGDSGAPVFVRGVGDSTVPVSGTVTVNALTSASKIQVEPVTSSANRTFVDNNSGHPVFVRGLTSSGVNVINDTATPLVVRGLTDTTVAVSGSITVAAVTAGAGVGLNGLSSATGALLAQTFSLSSLAQTVITAVGRLYGYSVSNPDTAANVWFHIYPDDSAGVTLGTSSALISHMAPFGGGREASWPQGVLMSSGMSLTASLTAASTAHDAPSTTITMTVYYAAST